MLMLRGGERAVKFFPASFKEVLSDLIGTSDSGWKTNPSLYTAELFKCFNRLFF